MQEVAKAEVIGDGSTNPTKGWEATGGAPRESEGIFTVSLMPSNDGLASVSTRERMSGHDLMTNGVQVNLNKSGVVWIAYRQVVNH